MPMAPQLHIGTKPITEATFELGRTDPARGYVKKPRGGLWTSMYLGQYGSGWVQWCLTDGPEAWKPKGGWPSWLIYPRSGARVLAIDTLADLEAAVRRYGYDYHAARGMPRLPFETLGLDFDAIAREYDAVHLTEEGQWRTRLSYPLDLYGWDCESTVWLRWAFEHVECLGNMDYAVLPDEVAVT